MYGSHIIAIGEMAEGEMEEPAYTAPRGNMTYGDDRIFPSRPANIFQNTSFPTDDCHEGTELAEGWETVGSRTAVRTNG